MLFLYKTKNISITNDVYYQSYVYFKSINKFSIRNEKDYLKILLLEKIIVLYDDFANKTNAKMVIANVVLP